MSRERRLEAKRRRRERRVERRQERTRRGGEADSLVRLMRSLKAADVPAPDRWPGAADPKLDRPDRLKYEICGAASHSDPGRSKLARFESCVRRGVLGRMPEIEHWAMEEFFWHGVPGDSWHPLEAYLSRHSELYSPVAQEQLRRWKEARLGIFEIGEVHDDTVTFREWDPVSGVSVGPAFRAISLNIGGVNVYRRLRGKITLTYVSPWSPAEDLYCAMGYGIMVEQELAEMFLPLLGLRHPELAARVLPWETSGAASAQHLGTWRTREWHSWLQDRLQFPFLAVVLAPPGNRCEVRQLTRLMPATPEQTRQFGVYFEVLTDDDVVVCGATGVTPLEIASPNLLPIAEYHAYRDRVGPPPGTRGKPAFLTLEGRG